MSKNLEITDKKVLEAAHILKTFCKTKTPEYCEHCVVQGCPELPENWELSDLPNSSINKEASAEDTMSFEYIEGMEAAWELIQKMNKMPINDLREVYGSDMFPNILQQYSPILAMQKYEEWADSQVKVGDIVEAGNNMYGVITQIFDDNWCYILYFEGSMGTYEINAVKKTSRKFNIKEVLNKLAQEVYADAEN